MPDDPKAATPNRINDAMLRVWGPLVITAAVLGLYGWIMVQNPNDPGLIEILKTLVVACVVFWIGSSAGSKGNAQVPGITTPPAPPVVAPQAPAPIVVQTGSPANAEAPTAAPVAARGGPLIQGLPKA